MVKFTFMLYISVVSYETRNKLKDSTIYRNRRQKEWAATSDDPSNDQRINDEFIIALAIGAIKLKKIIVDFFSQTIKIIYSNRQVIAALKTILYILYSIEREKKYRENVLARGVIK